MLLRAVNLSTYRPVWRWTCRTGIVSRLIAVRGCPESVGVFYGQRFNTKFEIIGIFCHVNHSLDAGRHVSFSRPGQRLPAVSIVIVDMIKESTITIRDLPVFPHASEYCDQLVYLIINW